MADGQSQGTRFQQIYMVGHAHLDPVWLWQWTEGYQEARATVRAAVQLLAEDPDYVFTLEQMAVLEWVRESEPDLFDQVRELVKAGRIAMVGGWWVEPDCNLPCLEAFIRHGLIGQRYLLEHFGGIAATGLNSDPFGHSAALPQVLKGHRLNGYCFLRPGPHETEMAETFFTWVGHDGSAVPAYRIPHEYCSPGGDIDAHVESAVAKTAPGVSETGMIFYGVGNHGGGPTRQNLHSLARMDAEGTYGRLVPAGPGRIFAEARDTGRPLPEWRGELQRHAAGCYAAHSEIKRLNLRAEAALLEAERYATLSARLDGVSYPAARMDAAWKDLLFNQFHDILPGSSIEQAYEDAAHDLGGVIATAGKITNRALQVRASKVEVPLDDTTQPILLFNPHPYSVRVPVEFEVGFNSPDWCLRTEAGQAVPAQSIQMEAIVHGMNRLRNARVRFLADVPALGHALYRFHPEPEPAAEPEVRVDEDSLTMQNAHLRVRIDPDTGWLASCVRLSDGLEFAPEGGAPHTVVSEDASDTWGHRVETYVTPGESFVVEKISVVEDGPVSAAIRVISRCGASRLTEVYRLHADHPALELGVEVDWREQCKVMKLRFPTRLDPDVARYGMQNGYVERPADGMEYPGQRWVSIADDGGRFAVINDAKYAYDCSGGDIGITAARSPVYAWHDPRELSPEEHYKYQDQGIQRFRCLIVADDGSAPLDRLADTLVMPVRVMPESFHSGTGPARQGHVSGLEDLEDVALTALKPWEGGEDATILRLASNADKPREVRLTLDFLGDRALETTLGAFQVRTFLVPADATEDIREVDMLEFPADQALPYLSERV